MHLRSNVRAWSLLAALLALMLAIPATATATQSSDAIAAVNELRALAGVDPIVDDAALADDCRLHATWMSANRSVSHLQLPGSPSFSLAGNDAAQRSVLHSSFQFVPQASGDTVHWRIGSPLHLWQLLHPGLVRSGYAAVDSYACMWTLNPRLRPGVVVHDRAKGRDQLFTWPVDGATAVPTREDTSGEDPNPNTDLGLPRAQVTGPYVLLWAGGFGGGSATCNGVRITDASLGPVGGEPVTIRWWDDQRTRDKYGMVGCPVPAGGGYLVAERPLAANTRYEVTVDLLGLDAPAGTAATRRTFSFTTGTASSGTGAADRTRPVVRLAAGSARKLGKRRHSWRFVATVRDASPTTCSATVQRRRVRCQVRSGRVVVAGSRAGQPRRVAFALVVRDSAGNVARLRANRAVR